MPDRAKNADESRPVHELTAFELVLVSGGGSSGCAGLDSRGRMDGGDRPTAKPPAAAKS